MRKVWILFLLFFAGTAHAALFLKVTKSNSVIGYKEPSIQSKMLSVFGEGDEVEIVLDKDGWYKVKVPFSQGYFVLGWVLKNSPNIKIIQRVGGSVVAAPVPIGAVIQQEQVKQAKKRSTGLDRSDSSDAERWNDSSHRYAKVFLGPVYDLYKYGAFQYKVGVAYEIPISQSYKLGFPVSYLTGDGFNAAMLGLENTYSYYFDWFAISPKLGVGYEYFYGNDKSFQAISAELGFSFDVSVSNHITLGVEPFTVQPMLWNTTDSISKIPFNVRGQSLLVIRGRW